LAIGCHVDYIRRLDVLGSTRVLHSDPTIRAQLLQDSVPKEIGHLVPDLWYPQRLLAIWTLVRIHIPGDIDTYADQFSGRNWQFLWQAADVPKWAVVVMIAIFFIGIWGVLLGVLISTSLPLTW
jgi:hypothetical protein